MTTTLAARLDEMDRRAFLFGSLAAAAVIAAPRIGRGATPYELPALPYAETALEPVISSRTIGFHYGKHHKGYVDNLNKLLADAPDLAELPLPELIKTATANPNRTAVFNNAAQVWNHSFFWNCMKPGGGGTPRGALADAINKKWGSFDEFKKAFQASAVGNFGSGWTWLVKKPDGSVDIVNTSNAATPLTTENKALLTIDVWEHAYYVDYRNARPKFVETYLANLANWDFAAKNFAA